MLKKKILILLTAVLVLLAAAGCGKQEESGTEQGESGTEQGTSGTEQGESGTEQEALGAELATGFQKFELDDLLNTVHAGAFTVSDDGEFFLAETGKICRYSANGTLLAAYENVESAEALCLMGQELFVATYDERLLRISLEDGKTAVVAEQFPEAQNLVSLVSAGSYLYVHVLNKDENCIKRVSPATGETQDVEIAEGTLRAVYGSNDGHLYYCMEHQAKILLYEYSEDKKNELKYDLTDRMEIYTAVQTFVCEQGLFLYTTPEKYEMSVFSLSKELYASVPTDGPVLFGIHVACAAGNVVYRDGNSLRTVYLGDLELKKPETPKLTGTIVVRTDDTMNGRLDAVKIQQISGLKTKLDGKDYDSDEFLTELMAGNPDVDIYMIYIGDYKFCRDGLYEPLNSSRVIRAYRDSCFPCISEEMQTETGDIWMLPIAVSMPSLWYVEENLEKFGVDPNRLRTMDSFLELSKEMKRRLAGTEYYTYANVDRLGDLWSDQYTRVYCDVPNGIINYKTEAYRKFYDEVWTGWIDYGPNPEHPYIERQRAENFDGIISNGPLYSTKKMLYKYCTTIGDHLCYGGLEGWRVMPAPKFSEEVPGDTLYGIALVLNPNSRQKELAMAYLEAVAANPVNIYRSEYYSSFLFQDIDVYREAYDVDLPAFRDLYELFAGATAYPYPTGYKYYFTIVDDYQNGRLTLDEALDTLQREMDMYLNE